MASFISMIAFCIYIFLSSVSETLQAILGGLNKINFDKGAFYLLGVAVGLIDLIWLMVYQGILKRPLNDRVTRIFSRVAIISLITTFSLPLFSHIVIDELVENKGYKMCEPAGNTWFYFSEVVYFKSTIACVE